MKKVVLVYADSLLLQRPANNEPHTSIIHSMLEARGVKVWSLYNKSMSELKEVIYRVQPDFIGVAVNCAPHLERLLEFFKALRANDLQFSVVAYGAFPTLWADYIVENGLKGFDYLIRGEPEKTFCEIICSGKVLASLGVYMSDNETAIDNLDNLPFPKVNIPNELNTRVSRGCFHECLFCYERKLYKSYRYRSVGNVIEEIGDFIGSRENHAPWVFFSDLDFLAITEKCSSWLYEFVEAIKQHGFRFRFTIQTRADRIDPDVISMLSTVGLSGVALGVESGSQRVLELFNKKTKGPDVNKRAIETLKCLKVPIKINFIMYEPTTTLDDIRRNVHFLKSVGFPVGTIPSQPPASSFDKVRIMMNMRAYSYYKSMPNLKIWEEGYWVYYDFLHKDTQRYYGAVGSWRKETSRFLMDYYRVLNRILYPNEDGASNSFQSRLKVLYLGNVFRRIDLQLMEGLVDATDRTEVISQGRKKIDDLHSKLNRIEVGVDNEKSGIHFRGWHGDLQYLIHHAPDS